MMSQTNVVNEHSIEGNVEDMAFDEMPAEEMPCCQ
jgi:hypothetical protein